ncbi:hypothetical protein [Mariluticola halotolerans]|uniref:hypothetical protein n=1 Tax=Mariluticola halotolerans TaxID=2909283 RepID=UPI0026E384EB|nr:hypothetical protein [Mariluticola halotolerans]UJQ94130.1 hypothetical protein L1P08_14395 [Mariluticola halotolerans]
MTKTPLTEPTPLGDQMLIAGIAPITAHDRLMLRAAAPILPKRNPDAAQKPCDFGLFDLDDRDQCDLIDFLRATEPGAPTPDPLQED